MNKWMILSLSAACAATVPLGVVAAEDALSQQVRTAQEHAQLAAAADSLDMTRTHLHHVINCLVGEDGEDFDADAGNPCDGMGAGALPDSKGAEGAHDKLQTALADLRSALDEDDQEAVQKTADQVAQALADADDALRN